MAVIENPGEKAKPADWTTEIPMVDLETVLKLVSDVHEKALENATMAEVSKKMGYASATSSPFYRRVVAARLFGLLGQGASLTETSRDYIRPDDEGTKSGVLVGAIHRIPLYIELLSRYEGKKLNVDLVANVIVKDLKLTDACAMVCAKVFESSIKFAGMLASDGSVTNREVKEQSQEKLKSDDSQPPTTQGGGGGKSAIPEAKDSQHHTIYLDKGKTRSFSFTGPLEITRGEYGRICKWLEFAMLIKEEQV